ncbi:MAG: tRNA dihydrouridine synthase DusB [Thermodesulfovibrionales bacterium]
MLTIGSVVLPSPCLLAPLAGISDLPFRMVNRSFGCGFAFAEMISARALVYRNRNTAAMLSSFPEDTPLGVQLLGNDPEMMKRALELLRDHAFDLLDINAACPVGKVTARGEGASLLRDPKALGALLRAVVAHSPVPVTLKIRAGWDDASRNALEVALRAREAGISGLFLHGRSREQGYSGRVDYRIIREVKEALDVPVIASGDALSPHLVRRMFEETGCDGVAVARGALGNPWIFKEIGPFLRDGTLLPRPEGPEVARTMQSHLDLCIAHYGEGVGTLVFRKFFAWYVRGFADIKVLKEQAFRAATREQMLGIIREVGETREHVCYSAHYR